MMQHTIRSDGLTVTIDELGAQLMSITAGDGTEYLWSGDPAYWRNRAPNLFPYVGRLTQDSYTCGGRTYPMTRHGFAGRTVFTPLDQGPDQIALRMTDSAETRACYPWAFAFDVIFRLEGSTLSVTYRVENRG